MISKSMLKVIAQPAYEPVSLSDVKDWCKVDNTDSDAILRMLRQALREDAENLTQRSFISRRLRLYMDSWPVCGYIELPFPPLISVESITYKDIAGNTQTLATSQYVVHSWKEPAIIMPEWNVLWPSIRSLPDSIQVDFTAGYTPGSPSDEASNQEVMPAKLRLWMQAKIVTLFDQRHQLVSGSVVRIPRDYTDGLLDSLTIGHRLF